MSGAGGSWPGFGAMGTGLSSVVWGLFGGRLDWGRGRERGEKMVPAGFFGGMCGMNAALGVLGFHGRFEDRWCLKQRAGGGEMIPREISTSTSKSNTGVLAAYI